MNGDLHNEGAGKRLQQWVVSLAVSIACCAVLFLVFASFLLDNHRQLIEMRVRSEMMESKLATLENSMMWSLRMNAQKESARPAQAPADAVAAPVSAP